MQINANVKSYVDHVNQKAENRSVSKESSSVSGGLDWYSMMESMMKEYLDAEIEKKNEKCKKVINELSRYKPEIAMEGMEALEHETEEKRKDTGILQGLVETEREANALVDEQTGIQDCIEETQDYKQLLKEKIEEICAKIKKGDAETSYQIGGQSFTEEEWDEFLEKFDSIEELIEKLMEEEQEKRKAEQLEKLFAERDDRENEEDKERTSGT